MKLSTKVWIVIVVVVLSVVADQVTKYWAEANLATPRYPDHTVELTVAEDGQLIEFLESELTSSSQQEIEVIATRYAQRDGEPIGPATQVSSGDVVELELRTITVIDGYWDFIYARNPGAAWSFMADAEETFRKTFFIFTTLLALCLIGFFLYKAEQDQRRLIFALALVMGGAIGNLIDRVLYGYVIDFIAWHIEDSYWPTFNIADAAISVGVGLMAIELLFGYQPEEEEDEDGSDKKSAASADKESRKSKSSKSKSSKPKASGEAKSKA